MRCTEAVLRRAGALALALAFTATATAAAAAPATPAAAAAPSPALPHVPIAPPAAPRDFDELQQQFAQRLVDAHPEGSYRGAVPARLYAIPVLEVELDRDGGVRRIVVRRHPTTGDEATRRAIAAVHNAAPYGDLSRLPPPWKLVEFFLFDDDLRFKPRTLDR